MSVIISAEKGVQKPNTNAEKPEEKPSTNENAEKPEEKPSTKKAPTKK